VCLDNVVAVRGGNTVLNAERLALRAGVLGLLFTDLVGGERLRTDIA